MKLGKLVAGLGGTKHGDRFRVERRGVAVEVRDFGGIGVATGYVPFVELTARVPVASLRAAIARGWDGGPMPPVDAEVWTAPVVLEEGGAVGRADGALDEIEGLLEAVRRALAGVGAFAIGCDGKRAIARVPECDPEGLDALVEVVVMLARWDRGYAAMLLELPDAMPLTGHDLVPGVAFAADGLRLGVRDSTRTVAELDGADLADVPAAQTWIARAGSGELGVSPRDARFTWDHVERDPARLMAGVRALRALRAGGPYR